MIEQINDSIRKIIKNESRPIPKGILMEKVKKNLNINNKKIIYDAINNLILNKVLKEVEKKYLVENYFNEDITNEKKVGVVTITSNLDGYVQVTDNNQEEGVDYYIHNINLNGALNNDIVEIILMDKFTNKSNIQHAIINQVIERKTLFGVGTFKLIGNTYEVELDDKKNYLKIKLDSIENLVNGYKILMQYSYQKDNTIIATVKKVIGHINEVGSDILSIIYSYGVEPEFSQEALDFVNNYKPNKKMDDKRKDLTHLSIVTIDPKTSKDLDDAIYVKKYDDHFLLIVSIADVSSYVPYKSALDIQTIERATSIYLVDRVVPMLPHKLSNDECSLNEVQKHRAITCEMKINFKGDILAKDVYPSWICSKKQFSYDEVNELFSGKKINIESELEQMLFEGKQLHKILRNKNTANGYIDFNIKEPKIIVDEKCFPIAIEIKQRGMAQMMIEDFMVIANHAVTIKAHELNMPFIYRIHEKPSLKKIEDLIIELKKWTFKIDFNSLKNPTSKIFAKCIKDNEQHPNIQLLSKLLLKCMSKAKYSIGNIGHFGLAIHDYTHFTSPIRRYPDLIVHRLFWMFYFNYENFDEISRKNFTNELEMLCEACTEKEIRALEIERNVNSFKFCQYMSKRIGQQFNGVISFIKPFGFFVELKNGIEGLVRIKNIGKDFWLYNKENATIIGEKTKKIFNFGDDVKIRVIHVNEQLRQIDFELVDFEKK